MSTDLKQHSLNKLEIPDLLRELTAVIAVITDDQGNVKDANRGFRFLLNNDNTIIENWNIREYFSQPSFSDLTTVYSEYPTLIYHGILNIGDRSSYCRSITGSVYGFKNLILIVGEHDIADLERLSSTVIELNEELTQLQRDIVKANRDLKHNEKVITEIMLTDPLTGIPNRRHFDQRIKEEIERHHRYGQPLTIAMGDIDLFKNVNDSYGHNAGDEVIKCFARTMSEIKRAPDFVARIGGEEFIVILPQTQIQQAHLVIDRMRRVFSEKKHDLVEGSITASFGITAVEKEDDIDHIIMRVDQRLYEAKASGRNKVVSHS